MKRHQFRVLTLAFVAAIAVLVSCATTGDGQTQAVESGVSFALAESRAANISDISYTLSFSIPAERQNAVTGAEELTFMMKRAQDLQLDFQADTAAAPLPAIITVNGTERPLEYRDEHILVSGSWLSSGSNTIQIEGFGCSDKTLNRNDDYLYTLFVPDHARSVFPCFDQPDLKAVFSLELTIPSGWTAISNGTIDSMGDDDAPGYQTIEFRQSLLLPTYLFSFTAGKFSEQTAERDGRTLRGLYRETDPQKVAQLPEVFDEIALSLRWLEEYTGMKCPYPDYGFVVLPGFQFGGMEHPGCIQYNDGRIFLGANPTPDELMNRFQLLAHETSHLWFGDMVTMRWFNDVWTKEVFANFMASKIAEEQFPDIDHDLNFLKDHYIPALRTDRTEGTHPIQQPLQNLNQAGLLYGNIIYHKAPVMMRKLEQQMGSDAFRRGLHGYLHRYAFSNATWDDLIAQLDSVAPDAGVTMFDSVWVKQKGLPTITYQLDGDRLHVRQQDPYGRGCVWSQSFQMGLRHADGNIEPVTVSFGQQAETSIDLPSAESEITDIIPNLDGSGYGRFVLGVDDATSLLGSIQQLSRLQRYAAAMTLQENYLMDNIEGDRLFQSFAECLKNESDALVASTLISYLSRELSDMPAADRQQPEQQLQRLAQSHRLAPVRQQLTRQLGQSAVSQPTVDWLYGLWDKQNDPLLSERDYMRLAYHLAIMRPAEWQDIIRKQRSRIGNADRQREFDFVSRACTPDTTAQMQLFESLLVKENRAVEPYALGLLSLLNDPTREPMNNRYILPALEALQDIQRTGDIFFPQNWCTNLLSQHRSPESRRLVQEFLAQRPDYPQALRNKILQAVE